nr:reverse transcriptase domain-containing protein [Tanacetum cinerariifolium]
STNTSTSGISPDVAELKDMVKAILLDKKSQNQSPATVKAIEESCVACGAYQAPAYQAPAPQTQGVSKEDFSAYVKANDAVMSNMQTQGQNMQDQLTNLTDLITNFVNSNSVSTSSSGTLPSNTIANPRSNLKAITTQSGVSYDGLQILPPPFFLYKSKSPILTFEPINSPISEPAAYPDSALRPNLRPSIPYPSRLQDQKLRDKANGQQVDAFLAIEDDPTSPEVYQPYLDLEGDILLLEAFLNGNPSLPPPNQGNYLLEVRKELKIYEAKSNKYSINEPPEVEIKDLPPHLEYAFLEGDNKLPVIIAKDLSIEEKTALITGGFTVVKNEDNELILTRLVTGWHVCIDYRKLNEATHKDHFPLPFMDQMLERLAGNQYYCFLDGFSSYFQIPIDPKDRVKTTFTCPYGMFAYRRMPFGLCNAPGTFQRCMIAIFHDMIEKTMEVFMDDFFVFGNSFQSCLSHLERMLKRCEDTNLCLNWETSHFMVKEGVVPSHKISKQGIEVDKAKVDVITKLPHPTSVKGIQSFLGHADFYCRFIKDFSKIVRPMI